MTKGINAGLAPLDSCSQPVFKWSPLLLFHFPRSACVPEIINCSNSNFNLGLEVWSFMTPWSSSNSLLLPTGLPLSCCSPGTPASLVQTPMLVIFFFLFLIFWIIVLLVKSWTTSLRGQMSTWPVQEELGTAGLPLLTSTSPLIFTSVSQGSLQGVFCQC